MPTEEGPWQLYDRAYLYELLRKAILSNMGRVATRPPDTLRPHPLAFLVPAMGSREYADLTGDIRTHGIQVALDVAGTVVLDGRHRLQIAKDIHLTSVPIRQVSLNGETPLAYMLKMAVLRRHLTDDQRATMAALWKQEHAQQARRPGPGNRTWRRQGSDCCPEQRQGPGKVDRIFPNLCGRQIEKEGNTMTIQELIDILSTMGPSKDAFVVLFKTDGTGEQFDIVDVSDNNGHAQLNIHEKP